jgi:hypothetical protein
VLTSTSLTWSQSDRLVLGLAVLLWYWVVGLFCSSTAGLSKRETKTMIVWQQMTLCFFGLCKASTLSVFFFFRSPVTARSFLATLD